MDCFVGGVQGSLHLFAGFAEMHLALHWDPPRNSWNLCCCLAICLFSWTLLLTQQPEEQATISSILLPTAEVCHW